MAKSRVLVTLLSATFLATGVVACGDDHEADRWAETNNTNVKIDWDKVNEAYKAASGPEDLERRVNEIYEGDEVISISVKDESKELQVVTGFFDKDKNGQVDEGEKIFTIKRQLEGEGKASYSTVGHGPHYGYYYSPTYSLVTGMVMGAMLSNAFSPRYVPMYTTAYTTSYSRVSSISSSRSSYRAANPSKFTRSTSTGRTYGTSSRSSGTSGGRSRGGGFGAAIRGRKTRLDA
jgi:hypothetical protein